MNKEHSLEEDTWHGTEEKPMVRMHFSPEVTPEFADHFFVERHWHHEVELLVIREGTFQMEQNLENEILRAGDICFVNSGDLHQLESCEGGSVHDALIFNPQILKCAYQDVIEEQVISPFLAGKQLLPHIIRKEDEGADEIRRICEWFCNIRWYPDDETYLLAKLELYRLLFLLKQKGLMVSTESSFNASEKEKIDRYKRVVTYMQKHFARKVTLEELALEARCNPQYLCHFFKEIAKISPIQYLISYRLERAKEMLRDTTKPVLEVSMDCGFENVSYFIRQFKKMEGVTPRAYRERSAICSLAMN